MHEKRKTVRYSEAKDRKKRSANPRTREKLMMEKMAALLSEGSESSFKEKLENTFGIKPGSPQFDAALKA